MAGYLPHVLRWPSRDARSACALPYPQQVASQPTFVVDLPPYSPWPLSPWPHSPWVCATSQAAFAPNFGFELPPYFLNNARAIATLEGMALSADPSFDVLKVVYPFALRRLLADPRGSPLLRQTLRSLTRDARGVPDLGRLRALLLDSAALSGRSRTAIMLDAALTRGGRAFACDFVRAWLRARVPWLRGVWAAWRASWRTPAETV